MGHRCSVLISRTLSCPELSSVELLRRTQRHVYDTSPRLPVPGQIRILHREDGCMIVSSQSHVLFASSRYQGQPSSRRCQSPPGPLVLPVPQSADSFSVPSGILCSYTV